MVSDDHHETPLGNLPGNESRETPDGDKKGGDPPAPLPHSLKLPGQSRQVTLLFKLSENTQQIPPQPPIPEQIRQGVPPGPAPATGSPGTGVTSPPTTSTANDKKGESQEMTADSEVAKERAMLALQIDQYYESSCRSARAWMALFVFFVLFELLMVLSFILSFALTYQSELITSNSSAGYFFTWWNFRVMVGAAFIFILLIMWAARFEKRWKLHQETLGKLAGLKMELTDSSKELKTVRDTLKQAIDAHNSSVKKQKPFMGT